MSGTEAMFLLTTGCLGTAPAQVIIVTEVIVSAHLSARIAESDKSHCNDTDAIVIFIRKLQPTSTRPYS